MSERIDVYVKVQNVPMVALRSEEVACGVVLDWQRVVSGEGPERVVGVEILDARSVEIDGVRVDDALGYRAEIARLRAELAEIREALGVPPFQPHAALLIAIGDLVRDANGD